MEGAGISPTCHATAARCRDRRPLVSAPFACSVPVDTKSIACFNGAWAAASEMRTRASSLAAPTKRTICPYPTMNRASGTPRGADTSKATLSKTPDGKTSDAVRASTEFLPWGKTLDTGASNVFRRVGIGCAFQEGGHNTEHRSVKCSVTISYADLKRSPGRASYATFRQGSCHRSQRS